MAALTLISLDPARPIGAEVLEAARALAPGSARDRERTPVRAASPLRGRDAAVAPAGRAAGHRRHRDRQRLRVLVRLDVGGDVFDYTVLPDGRLAVVVGDVTGKGIDAAADMAMTKFVFRSLAREHPEPSELMRIANQVVLDEVEEGKFVTMLYLTSTLRPASSPARAPVIRSRGSCGRTAPSRSWRHAGSRSGSRRISSTPRPGRRWSRASVVLFTDGVVESRVGAELYGKVRLDRLLGEQRALRAQQLARAVVEDSRAFAGGGLADDSAVVVVKKILKLSFQATLTCVVFAAGVGTLATEIAASRLLAPYWELHDRLGERDRADAGVALGRLLARRPARRPVPDAQALGLVVAAAACLVAFATLVARPILDLSVEGSTGSRPAPRSAPFFGVLILFVPPVTLMGMVAPFAIRLAIRDIESAGPSPAAVRGLDGRQPAGHVPCRSRRDPAIGTQRTLLAAAALIGASGAVLLGRRWLLLTAGLAALLLIPPGAVKGQSGVIFEDESRYQFIQVVEEDGVGRLYLDEGATLRLAERTTC